MDSGHLSRRIALVAGGAALVAMSTLTACSPTAEKEAPSTTSSTTSAPSSSSVAPSPTEKAVGPGGDNSFSPTINPTPPGAVCARIENGVCIR